MLARAKRDALKPPGERGTMRRFAGLLAISGMLLGFLAVAAAAGPLRNTDEVAAALQACWKPLAGSEDSFVTMKFSFRRDGSLIGRPLPAIINVVGDEKARQRFIDAAIRAIERCTPLDFAPAFAEGVGGHVFMMRFAAPRKRPSAPDRYASRVGTWGPGFEAESVCFAIADRPNLVLTKRSQAGMM
jgi:hypothetical protein